MIKPPPKIEREVVARITVVAIGIPEDDDAAPFVVLEVSGLRSASQSWRRVVRLYPGSVIDLRAHIIETKGGLAIEL